MSDATNEPVKGTDFIRQKILADNEAGTYGGEVVTRFPPEPNGYLHVGHATAICLNFGIAADFDGRCHLRYDDTNPEKEDEEYALAIQRDIRWLGFDWGEHLYYASDYFERMYECAESLIEKGLAYVDSQTLDEIREGRGSVTEPGTDSPYRDRSVEENLDLFRRMRAGEFEDGEHVLRGRIDMGHPNMLMRDPVLYRIRHAEHFRQGDAWVIYPLYDYAHCLEDAFEGVTHSICTIEFENNRELYDWVLESVGFEEPRPHQYEWAGLDLEGAVLSKRAILPLVNAGVVSGWDDPRLATISAFRRRGVPPEALHLLAKMVGVSRSGAKTEESKLDYAIREILNPVAPRVMAVLDPLRVVITNWPEGDDSVEMLDAPSFPPDVDAEGSRPVPFAGELWIDRSDFSDDPPKGYRRLVPGGEVRLRYGYVIRCDEVVRDESGAVTELRCSYDPETRGGTTPDGRKVKGTIHWLAAAHAVPAEVRLFSSLFLPDPADAVQDGEGADPVDPVERVDPDSLQIITDAWVEPSVLGDDPETRYQFERTGYFWRDPVDGRGERLVFNRIVALKSTWKPGAESGGTREASGAVSGAAGGDQRSSAGASRGRDASKDLAPGTRPQVSDEREEARQADEVLAERFRRYQDDLGLSMEAADLLTARRAPGDFFEAALQRHDDAPAVAGWIVTDVRGVLDGREIEDLPFDGAALGALAALVEDGTVSRRAAKDVLARMAESGGEPAALVDEMGLASLSGADTLEPVVDEVLAAWPEKVEAYRAGQKKLIGLFVGEIMKATRGAADPASVRALLSEKLDS